MALRIEIVGNSPTAQRMLHRMMAMKSFEITRVPEPEGPSIAAPRAQRSTTIELQGSRGGLAILQENPESGEIEGLPVVRLTV